MCKAISYVRWSHPTQTEGDSLQRQQDDFTTFCAAHKLTPCDMTYVDAGVSGWTGLNLEGQLGEILKAIKGGTIEKGTVLVVEQLDRLTREDIDIAMGLLGKILRAGVPIGHVRSGRILTKEDLRGFGVMNLVTELILANEESNKKSERVKHAIKSHRQRAREGKIWTSKGPAWLELSEDRTKWIVKKEEAAKVKYIYKLSIAGSMGFEAIVKKLNAEGIKPIGKKGWSRNYVRSILRDKRVLGEYQPTIKTGKNTRKPEGEPIQDYYVRIIDDNTYYKAQAQIDGRRRHRGPVSKFVNLFSGLVYDKATKSTMWLATKPQRDGSKDKSLYPSAAIQGNGDYWSLSMSKLEPCLLTVVWECELDSKPSPDRDTLDGLKAKRETLLNKIEQATRTIADHPDFASALNIVRQLETDKTNLDGEIEQLEAKIADNPEDTLASAKSAIVALATAKEEDKKELRLAIRAKLRSLIERIDLTKQANGTIKSEIIFKVGETRTVRLDGECFWIGKKCFYVDSNLRELIK